MSLSTLATIVGTHAKTAAAVLAVSAATGGGLAVATTVANSHAAPGLEIAKAAPNASASADASQSADATQSPDATPTTSAPATPVTCDNAKNHGAYVSSVAHATPTPSGTASPAPNAHGKAVSAAAQSSCGKPASAGGSDSTDSTDSTDSGDSAVGTESGDRGKPTTVPPSHPAHPNNGGHGH